MKTKNMTTLQLRKSIAVMFISAFAVSASFAAPTDSPQPTASSRTIFRSSNYTAAEDAGRSPAVSNYTADEGGVQRGQYSAEGAIKSRNRAKKSGRRQNRRENPSKSS